MSLLIKCVVLALTLLQCDGWTSINPFLEVDAGCPRFAAVGFSTGAGAGHQFGDFVFTFILATEMNATVIYDDRITGTTGDHGENWIHNFLHLESLPYNLSMVQQAFPGISVVHPVTWADAVRDYSTACKVVVIISDNTCEGPDGKPTWCFMAKRGAYQSAKWPIRELFYSHEGTGMFKPMYDESNYNIALHLRTGDITPHANEVAYFENLIQFVTRTLKGITHKYYIFFMPQPGFRLSMLRGKHKNLYPVGFESLEHILPKDTVLVSDLGPEASTRHFMASDMLITTGSSFPSIAGLLTMTSTILSSCPKEGCSPNIVESQLTDDMVLITASGLPASVDDRQLRSKLVTMAFRKRMSGHGLL